jgi:AraC family transcriptional regulator
MKEPTLTDWHGKVEKALDRMFAALESGAAPRALDGLEDEIASSPWHFRRTFAELTGETPIRCFRRLRLERSMRRLRSGESSVTNEAFEAGFDTPEGFTKAFRKAFGISPQGARHLPDWKGTIPSPAGIHYREDGTRAWFTITKEFTMYKVKIVSLPEMTGYGVENIGDYWNLPKLWGPFMAEAAKLGFVPPKARVMTVFKDHSDAVPMEKKRSYPAALMPESAGLKDRDGLVTLTVPSGLYAIYPHFGSHEEIGDAWDDWRKNWLPTSGWKLDPARPSLEWYQNGDEGLPAELYVTLLCDPVLRE